MKEAWEAENGEIPRPTHAVAGLWVQGTDGIHIGWGLTNNVVHKGGAIWQSAQPETTTELLKPFEGYNVHIMNEAFSDKKSWSEGSLLMAERVFQEVYGAEMP